VDHLSRYLTPREREVALLVAEGRTNAEIGQALATTPTTAKWHVSQILRKLGLRSRVQLAVCAQAHAGGPAVAPPRSQPADGQPAAATAPP
jgi:DNA-binding NarL/FixJ family response regulator